MTMTQEQSARNGQAEDVRYVSFSVREELYGIPIDAVRQIIRVPRITRVPKSSPFMLGITNMRGTVLPLIDLSLKLGNETPCELGEDARVIVLEQDGIVTGLVVERVSEVKSVSGSRTDVLPEMLDAEVKRKFISGVIHTEVQKESRMILLLDLTTLLEVTEEMRSLASLSNNSRSQHDAEHASNAVPVRRFISFFIGAQEYAIGINRIREIIRLPEVVTIPGLPAYVRGIFSLREEVIPLISLRSKFRKGADDLNDDVRIVNVEIDGTKIGLLVDRVFEVLSVEETFIEQPPVLFTGEKQGEIASIARVDGGDRLVMVLEPANLLSAQEVAALKVAAGAKEKSVGEQHTSAALDERQIITFTLETEEYGVAIEAVQEINRYTNVTRVPKTPDFVEGIINLRGEVIPLIDLRRRFSLEGKVHDEFTRIIIVNIGQVRVGFIVDKVEEVLRIPERSVENVPVMLSSAIDSTFIKGVVNLQEKGRMILLLDVGKMFSNAELKNLEQLEEK